MYQGTVIKESAYLPGITLGQFLKTYFKQLYILAFQLHFMYLIFIEELMHKNSWGSHLQGI